MKSNKISTLTGRSIGRIYVKNSQTTKPEYHLIVGLDRKYYTFLNLNDWKPSERAKVLNKMASTRDFTIENLRIADRSLLNQESNSKIDYDAMVDGSNYRSIKWQ